MSGAVDELTRALAARDAEAFAACFAPDGRLELRSVERTWEGRDQVRDAAEALFAAFPDLTWRPRSRWLDEGRTVEEGTWAGTHTGDLADWPPATETGVELRARVFVEHNGTLVHGIEVYTDLVGLRLALGLPVTSAAEAADTSRLASDAGDAGVRVFVRPEDRPAPPPRRRQALGVLAAAAAVLVAGAIVVLNMPGGTSTAEPNRPAGTPTQASAAPTPSPTKTGAKPKPSSGVVERGNNLDLSTDVLFGRGSAVLNGHARGAIAEVGRVMRARDVRGVVRVNGYTDNLGSAAYGIALSRQRAEAVAAALRPQLRGGRVRMRSRGLGEANPVAGNATEAGRQRNRRVTIVLPKP